MHHFIDRRLNPRDKSLGNRMRFLKRTRSELKEYVDKAVRERNVEEASKGGTVTVPSKGIKEPAFHHARSGGDRDRVLPGNREFIAGDRIDKPKSGEGGGGRNGSETGDGEDDFTFTMSESEFLDILFEDLELPDLVKASLKDAALYEYRRAGHSTDGTTPNLNVLRTMRHSLGRRIALHRPKPEDVVALEAKLAELDARDDLDDDAILLRADIVERLETLKRRQRAISYIDPIDVRYNRFEEKPIPRAKAVMFCLMDVSASMGETEKDLAKRFYILLHLFLKRRYQRVDVVFIRHTHEAKEVSEQEFFFGKESGGTVVSSALEEMIDIREERYPSADWNVYVAQASDGDNTGGDSKKCVDLLTRNILPKSQFFAYIEIAPDATVNMLSSYSNGKDLWKGYAELDGKAANFAMKKVSTRADIYPVFRELFAKSRNEASR